MCIFANVRTGPQHFLGLFSGLNELLRLCVFFLGGATSAGGSILTGDASLWWLRRVRLSFSISSDCIYIIFFRYSTSS